MKSSKSAFLYLRLIAVAVLFSCAALLSGQEVQSKLTVAAAADMQYVLQEIGDEFQSQTGTQLVPVYGSSGSLFAQIQNGAPFDVFLSADMDYCRKLVSAHVALPDSLYRYAIGRLVLWAPPGSKVDVNRGMDAVLDPAVTRIAIANPRHAPYGRAAVEALNHAKLYKKIENKLVLGENVSQAAQFVESGNAQLGFVSLSLVFAPTLQNKGNYFLVPTDTYSQIEQGAVILANSAKRRAAEAFLAFLKKPEGVRLLKKYGFVTPMTLGGSR
jgi:molybdate transport system substrate-binding protein